MKTASTKQAYVLVAGDCQSSILRVVEKAARMAGQTVLHEREQAAVADWVGDDENPPAAVVLEMEGPGSVETALRVRAQAGRRALPVIALASEVTNLVFEEAFAVGIDDVCRVDVRALGRRLRVLADAERAVLESTGRRVVVADEDQDSRSLIGRVFRDAGYGVVFAPSAAAARQHASDAEVAVVVVSSAIDVADGEPISQCAARPGNKVAWIVNTPPKQIPAVRARLGLPSSTKLVVHDAFASPATLLFVANELLNQRQVDGRASARLLYGSAVRFRQAGRDEEDFGYLFNISAGGLYVCTLAPPERDQELWIELTPPRSERLVHLEATCVWARRYGPGRGATVPCGFGVKLTGGSDTDIERYQRGYRAFLAERQATRALAASDEAEDGDSSRQTVPVGASSHAGLAVAS